MTVDRLRQQMPADEFCRWGVYFGRKAQREEMATRKAHKRGGGR